MPQPARRATRNTRNQDIIEGETAATETAARAHNNTNHENESASSDESDSAATPSASFIGNATETTTEPGNTGTETAGPRSTTDPRDTTDLRNTTDPGNMVGDNVAQVKDLGFKIYSLSEKNVRMRSHAHFIKTCLQENIIPTGLVIEKKAAVSTNDEDFNKKWNSILRECSQKLMECLVDHYENQLTKNTMAISEAYDSLGTIENWSREDRHELENEVHNHLEAQEKLLKEQKERKLEMVRRNRTTPPPTTNPRETYAEILKKHIREKVNPGNYERQENWRYARRFRRPRQEQQQPYSNYRRYGEFRYRFGFQPTREREPQYYQEMWRYAPRRRRFLNEGPTPRGRPRE